MPTRRQWLAAAAAGAAAGTAIAALMLRSRGDDSAAGRRPSAFSIGTADGRRLSLADFRDRFVLLNLWATWCPPCVKEMPALDRLQATKGNAGFEVVALSIDRQGLAVIEPFFRQRGLSALAIYLDREGTSMSALKVTGLPTTLLIDPAGREIARWVGPREWDSPEIGVEIEALMAKARMSAA